MSIEYAGAVGMMVIDELAKVNERVSLAVDRLKEKSEELSWDYEDLDSQLEEEKEKQVVHLELEHHQLCWDMALAKAAASECVLQMAELMMEVQAMWLMNAVCQHGLMNPIIVEDNKVVEEGEVVEEIEEEGSDFDGNQVVFLDVGRFSPVLGILVLIEENPWDVAQEVERVEEREELRCCDLMMDDQAFQEVMEIEQLVCYDPVLCYQPAPGYDMPSHPDLNSDEIVFANRVYFLCFH